MLKKLVTSLFLVVFLTSFAQNKATITKKKTPNAFINKETVKKQFDYVFKISTTYKNNKVVNINTYYKLKKNVLDSLIQKDALINKKKTQIVTQEKSITSLTNNLERVNLELNQTTNQKNERSFLGIKVNKTTFSTLLAIVIGLLSLLLFFFIFKYKSNIYTTNSAINNYESLFQEFEDHKKTSLQRYQEVNRKLQDELNKKWKSEK